MGKQDVVVRLTVQDAQAVAAWQRAKQGPKEMGDEIAKVGQKAKRSSEAGSKGFQRLTRDLKTTLAATFGVSAAISTLRQVFVKEMDTIERRQQGFFNQQLEVARTFRAVNRALGGGQDVTIGEAEQLIQQGTFGVPEAESNRLMVKLLSSKGAGFSARRAIGIGNQLNRLTPDLVGEERADFGVAVLEVIKAFESEGVTDEEAIFGTIKALTVSKSTDIGKFARSITASVSQVKRAGGGRDDFAQLMASIAAVQQVAIDPEGRRTATAFQKFSGQLKRETFPFVGKESTFGEQLAFVRGDSEEAEEIRVRLLGVLSRDFQNISRRGGIPKGELLSEERVRVAIGGLLERGSSTFKEEQAALASGLALDETAVAFGRRREAALNRLPSQQLFQAEIATREAVQTIKRDAGPALEFLRRKSIQDVLLATGVSGTRAGIEKTLDQILTDETDPARSLSRFEDKIRGRASELRLTDVKKIGFGVGAEVTPATEREKRQAEVLDKLADALNNLIRNFENQPAKVEVVNGAQAPPVPASAEINDRLGPRIQ